MEKNEIFIGRQVEKGNFLVDKQYTSVGRRHARIIRRQDGIYIEDLDTVNGTFVNGKAIKIKKLNNTDQIYLGGEDYYELNLAKVLCLLPISESDFNNEFLRLKIIYENYQTEKNQLESQGQADMMTKRMLPTMVLGAISGILVIFSRIWGAICGVLTIGVFFIATTLAKKSALKMKIKLDKLNTDFELEYVCPACRKSLKGKSWEFHKRQGECPFCHREWKID